MEIENGKEFYLSLDEYGKAGALPQTANLKQLLHLRHMEIMDFEMAKQQKSPEHRHLLRL